MKAHCLNQVVNIVIFTCLLLCFPPVCLQFQVVVQSPLFLVLQQIQIHLQTNQLKSISLNTVEVFPDLDSYLIK